MEDKSITIEYVKSLTTPSEKFLCSLSDNIYDIKFLSFRVRDLDSGFVLFEVEDNEENNSVLEIVGKSTRKRKSLTGTVISKKHSS